MTATLIALAVWALLVVLILRFLGWCEGTDPDPTMGESSHQLRPTRHDPDHPAVKHRRQVAYPIAQLPSEHAN